MCHFTAVITTSRIRENHEKNKPNIQQKDETSQTKFSRNEIEERRKKNTLKSSFNDRPSISTQTLIIIIIRICSVGGKVLSPLEGNVDGFDGYRKYYGQLSAYNDRSISLTRTVFIDDIL